ncbi:N-acetylglucosamine-6-phosphate deacetylase [Kurthia zopfii]|uniref:N-acetylglucosamine-6-phosphate deacetylase n=1 Tax=Kurthia zopfii TaxID=1650 RepID=A0A8B4QBP8_9BACL|nr:N-acetylglucosamine-6-phosphate deacetylase [Kurthia zopfii]PWI24014.1 N-acetylglucosamine-6-phosphate deacetylase [Kurthia zopfii]TDR44267.1 N-acetylglucosamine 6-phosphate deacetylase [Kurthia zopfii]GEK29777.1 N-acetylglucosamine-6-phosphate deacetylase [Kurthia zopfii]STX10127.1 N-acetylglucosamine-6-phosphate deacetylase [Kurthia zopfii]
MTNSILIKNVQVVNANYSIEKTDVYVVNGKIQSIEQNIDLTDLQIIDGSNQILFPGFIDMHIHGSAGVDTMDGKQESLHKMAKSLVKEGVTGFLATTMTQKLEEIEHALEAIGQFENDANEAEILGVHIEGPFISIKRVGAQPEEYIIPPNIETFNHWQKLSGGMIKEITVAPEVEGGFDFVKELSKQGIVVSIGHSDATLEEVERAVSLGAKQGTHLYNQMRPFHHRDPGVVGGTLLNNQVKTEIIVDFIHSHPKSVEFAYRLKGASHIILITDAMRAKGVPYGDYDLGGQMVHVTETGAHLPNGALAGSILTMDRAIRNMKQATNCSLEDLVAMSSYNAAQQMNLSNKGVISVNADADFVLLSKDLVVQKTIKAGKVVYE